MSIDLIPAAGDHHDEHGRHAGHPHPAAVAAADAVSPGSGSSPLWWSASQRLACAALLAAILWLVIAWAVA